MIIDNIPYKPDNVIVKKFDTIRIKITNSCQLSCSFCHAEGSESSDNLSFSEKFIKGLNKLKSDLNLTSVHLTGGEPTSFSRLEDLLHILHDNDFTIKITTNGQLNDNILNTLKSYNISSINFSVHTLNPIKLALLQNPPKNFYWGLKTLENQLHNMTKAKEMGLRVKLNTVILEDSSIHDIISLCKSENFELRILNDLNIGSLSIDRTIKLLTSMGAEITGINIIEHVSAASYDVQSSDGFKFKVKSINNNILPTLCNNCKKRDNCIEWFYGIRIEFHSKEPFVRLCLHRNDSVALQTFDNFFISDQYSQLIEYQNKSHTML
ncbi:radical SAM protein [Candidatus Neomarinimicrobiota bacterium]